MASAARVPIAIAGVVIAAVLLQRSRRLIAASRRLPAPNEAQKKANRSIWIKFWINFVFEIVLLNIAITLLSARSEEHTSELQSLMRISYAVFCLKKKNTKTTIHYT